MSDKQTFTENDLQVGLTGQFTQQQGVFKQTHTVIFGRSLTQAERELFIKVLTGFYYTVRFSRQFGNGLVAEPVVKFDAPDKACYTLTQTTSNGGWKDLLFSILANFSHEIVPIRLHDESRVFHPQRIPSTLTQDAKSVEASL
jgi:hypothetical protein